MFWNHFYSWVSIFLDYENLAGWMGRRFAVNGLLKYDVRRYITLLHVFGVVNLWAKVTHSKYTQR